MNPCKENLELRRDFDGAKFEKTELFISVWVLALFRAAGSITELMWVIIYFSL